SKSSIDNLVWGVWFELRRGTQLKWWWAKSRRMAEFQGRWKQDANWRFELRRGPQLESLMRDFNCPRACGNIGGAFEPDSTEFKGQRPASRFTSTTSAS